MKNLYSLFIITICLLFSTSCNDFLDIKPKGVTIPETFEDYNRLMNHDDLMYIDNTYTVYLSDDVLLGEDDLMFGKYSTAQEHWKNLYAFNHGAIFSGGVSDDLWEKAYKRIYTLNTIINKVPDCLDADEQSKKELIAKARFTRAYEYLILINAYANHYDLSTADIDLGVPLILSIDIEQSYRRNTVAEVYEQILIDLEYAEKNLPDNVSSYYFPDKKCAHALMARAYLYMGDYEKAKNHAEQVIVENDPLIDLTEYIINPDPTKYSLGRIYNPNTESSYPLTTEGNSEILLCKQALLFMLSMQVYVNPDLLDVFEHDLPEGAIDQRRNLFMSDNKFSAGFITLDFPGKTMWVEWCDVSAGLNYQETMLTLAECYVRLNMQGKQPDGIQKAYTLIDRLRDKRIKNNQSLPQKDAQSALRTVLEERRRELAFRGSLRLFDLKRLNKEEVFKKEIKHTVGDEIFILPPNDPRYILPLPPKVIAENPGIPQIER